MPPPPPRQINPTLSLACEQMLLQGLAKAPAQRPASAHAFVAALQQATTNTLYEPTLLPAHPINTEGFSSRSASDASATRPDATPTTLASTTMPRTGLTRRQLFAGGSAALVAVVAGAGLGTWALTRQNKSTHNNTTSQHNQSQHTGSTQHNLNAPVLTLLGHNHPVSALSWSPTTSMLASAGSNGDGQVFLWNVPTLYQHSSASPHYTARQQFDGATNSMLLAWSYDGSKLAIGNVNSTTNLSNMTGTTNISVYSSDLSGYAPGYNANFVVSDTNLEALAWTIDGYLLGITIPFASSNSILHVWDAQHPQQQLAAISLPYLLQTTLSMDIGPFAPSPHDAHMLAFGTPTNVVVGTLIFAGQNVTFKQKYSLQLAAQNKYDSAGAITWDKGGTYLAATPDQSSTSQTITIWNVQAQVQYNPRTLPTQATGMTTLAWCPVPASTLFAAGTTSGQVYIWDFSGNTSPIRTLRGINASITALAWSADGQWLAAAYQDTNDSILVWKI